jgi:GTP diphosphokinase / guanosine-3',5'-bis(diphosphate) 3'-diphosphatase
VQERVSLCIKQIKKNSKNIKIFLKFSKDSASMNKIFEALQYASIKHKGQTRKGCDSAAYINHPIAVTNTLINIGKVNDEDTIIASILHDVIEDTNTKEEEIAKRFNLNIANVVMEVSDNKWLPSEIRKQKQIDNAPNLSLSAKQIRIADKVCNVRDIIDFPPKKWDKKRRIHYLEWTKKVIDQIRGTNELLENLYDNNYNEGINKLTK